MKKLIAVLIIILIVVGTGFGGYKYLEYKHRKEMNDLQKLYEQAQSDIDTLELQNENLKNPPKIQVTVKTLKEYTAPASELITYKYFYTDAGTYEKGQNFGKTDIPIPFSTDKVVYVYSGEISAGIDVSEIKYVVDDSNMKIIVAMPEPKIIAHEMDEKSLKSYDVKNSVFTSSSLENYAEFTAEIKATQEDKLLASDAFWKNVKGNTENVIKDLLTCHDEIKDYKLEFNWVKSDD